MTSSAEEDAPREIVHLDGLVVGPDEWLVLSPRSQLSAEVMQRIFARVPESLKGRVLIVDQMDMAAVTPSAHAQSLSTGDG